ncbi:unnamed protein product [Pieris macdunnoughi]|uniref:Uncharacterized protein n=1 Tax=Pieris macdunnoughi TaxID=345717 RepID=A0A821LP84_9NEOP|nr:unnamed protein product [Pieris macdunnoughi]
MVCFLQKEAQGRYNDVLSDCSEQDNYKLNLIPVPNLSFRKRLDFGKICPPRPIGVVTMGVGVIMGALVATGTMPTMDTMAGLVVDGMAMDLLTDMAIGGN